MKILDRLTSLTIKQSVVIILVVYLLDQITKLAVKTYIAPTLSFIDIIPFFSITYVQNTGSAFGMFKGLGNVFFVSIAFIVSVIMVYFIIKDSQQRIVYSLFIAGALGNATDRIVYGYVIDFLDLYVGRYHWPAFNVADSALTIAMGLIIWFSFIKKPST